MREIRHTIVDLDPFLEAAARAHQQHEADHWRQELRPRAIRMCAGRAAKLTWSRALLKVVVEELFPDDLFTEVVGNLDRVPPRQWPRLGIAGTLRHRWRRDGLARVARRLHVSLATRSDRNQVDVVSAGHRPDHHEIHFPARLGPVKALGFASTPQGPPQRGCRVGDPGGGAHGLDGALGRAMPTPLRDGRDVTRSKKGALRWQVQQNSLVLRSFPNEARIASSSSRSCGVRSQRPWTSAWIAEEC